MTAPAWLISSAACSGPSGGRLPGGWVCVCLVIALLVAGRAVPAADLSLHERIDRELIRPAGVNPGRCSDAEFLRRVSLDLTGIPPRAEETRRFIADTGADKRRTLIDQLMSSPAFTRHLALTLDVMLMERRGDSHVPRDEWLNWLLGSVRSNKPWNVLAREILAADGADAANRAPARFYLDRGSEPNLIARDLGRMFFGRDLQCAQCHDSPLVSDYLQADYQGLLAFTSTGYPVTRKISEKDVTVYAERAASDLSFESVFIKGTPHRTRARVPGGLLLAEPFFFPGEEYSVAPADGVRSVPIFSRRSILADQATNGSSATFNQNIANRLWAHMFGKGIVHPLDMIHPDNPPISRALLEQLADWLVTTRYDMRNFLRELALTEAYQSAFETPLTLPEQAAAANSESGDLSRRKDELEAAEAAARTTWDAALASFSTAEAAWLPQAVELDKARNQFAELRKQLDEAEKAQREAAAKLSSSQAALESLQTAATAAAQASQQLPEDKELAGVVTSLTARRDQLVQSIPDLQATAEQKSAALAAPTEALAKARTVVEAAVAQVQPFEDAVRTADAAQVAARQVLQKAAAETAAVRLRLPMTQRIAGLSDRHQTAQAAAATAASRESELLQSATQLAEVTGKLAERRRELAEAEAILASTRAAVSAAASVIEPQNEALAAMVQALGAVQALQPLMADGAELDRLTASLGAHVAAIRAASVRAENSHAAALSSVASAVAEVDAARGSLDTAEAEFRGLSERTTGAVADVTAARKDLEIAAVALDDQRNTVSLDLSASCTLAGLKPLTPEQLCWSILRVTGISDRQADAVAAELEKSAPLTESQRQDPAVSSQRTAEIEQRVFDQLKAHIATFAQFYGGGPGQPQGDFFASPDQALFTSNGDVINGWIVASGGNVTERIIQATDPRIAAEELYLAVLTRLPTTGEIQEVTDFLNGAPDRTLAAQELVWGLLNSAEFRFNH